ncbi:hypothetical protein MTO96_015057 [Rhipicephalus appendiculatus]
MDTRVTVPAADSKGVFVAFASCGLLVVIMLFLSTVALSKLGTFPGSGDHAGVHSAAKGPGVAAQVQDLVTPEDSLTNQATPVDRRAVVPRSRDRGRFPSAARRAVHEREPPARAERPESAGLLFGLPLFPYHLCTHAVFCCAHLNESSLQIEAPSDAHGFPRYLRGLNPHLRPILGLSGRMPAAMMSGSDWIFLESAIVWLTPRGYEGAVLLWKVSLETLAARRGYSELLERVSRRFSREGFVFSVLVDTGDSLNQRLNLGELGRGAADRRRQLDGLRHAEQQPLSPSLGGSGRSGIPAGVSQSSASKLCYVFSFAGVTYKFWDSNVTGVQEVVYGPGDPGPITKTPGELAYYEICNEARF